MAQYRLIVLWALYAHCRWHEQHRCSCRVRRVVLYKCYMPLRLCWKCR